MIYNLKYKKNVLMKNYFSAIYLDPRYMCLLNAASKKKAFSHLLKTWSLKESISLTAIAIEISIKTKKFCKFLFFN